MTLSLFPGRDKLVFLLLGLSYNHSGCPLTLRISCIKTPRDKCGWIFPKESLCVGHGGGALYDYGSPSLTR